MQIELCDHLFQKTTCVEMEMEVRNRNDEKKMNEDEEEESFHNDKLVLFCNLKLRKKSKVKRKSHTDELTQKKTKRALSLGGYRRREHQTNSRKWAAQQLNWCSSKT